MPVYPAIMSWFSEGDTDAEYFRQGNRQCRHRPVDPGDHLRLSFQKETTLGTRRWPCRPSRSFDDRIQGAVLPAGSALPRPQLPRLCRATSPDPAALLAGGRRRGNPFRLRLPHQRLRASHDRLDPPVPARPFRRGSGSKRTSKADPKPPDDAIGHCATVRPCIVVKCGRWPQGKRVGGLQPSWLRRD